MKGENMTHETETLTERDAATEWARAYNLLSPARLASLLAEDVHYASQWVFEEIETRFEYLHYLVSKLQAIRKTGSFVRAELAETTPYPMYPNPPRPCAVIWQDGQQVATVLFEVDGDKITRIDFCQVPPPHTCKLSGESPGLIAVTGIQADRGMEA